MITTIKLATAIVAAATVVDCTWDYNISFRESINAFVAALTAIPAAKMANSKSFTASAYDEDITKRASLWETDW